MARNLDGGPLHHRSAGASRSTRCARTARSSRSRSSSCRASAAASTIFLAYLRDLSERRAAERALAEREEQFRTIAESVPLGLVISDLETGRPLYINPQARRNLGLGPDETLESLLARLGEARAARGAGARGRSSAARPAPVEVDLAMPSGRRMQGADLGDAHPLRRPRRRCWRRPSTSPSCARPRRRCGEPGRGFHAFMDFAPVAAHLRDAEGRYLMFNRRMEELIGVPAAEALGRLPAEIRPPDVVGNSDRHHRLVVETGKLHVSEQYLTSNNPDDPRWTMAIRFPVLDADGKVEAVGTFAVDITERKAAEAALQASEARLNAINAANPVPMNIARLSDRKLLFVNEPYLRLFGLEGVDLDSFDRDGALPGPGRARLALRASWRPGARSPTTR